MQVNFRPHKWYGEENVSRILPDRLLNRKEEYVRGDEFEFPGDINDHDAVRTVTPES